MSGGDLTYDELVLAARNVGVDLGCGRCACVFYTGSAYPGPPAHDPGCATAAREAEDRAARGRKVWDFENAVRAARWAYELYREVSGRCAPANEMVALAHAEYVEAVRAYESARVALLEAP